MKVLLMISNPPFDGAFGGAEIFAKYISVHLSERGYEIHLLCRKRVGNLPNYEKINGVNIHRFSFPKIPKLTWMYSLPRSMLQSGKRVIEKFNIDIIYGIELYPTGWISAKLGKIYNLPVVLSLRNVHKYYMSIFSNLPFPIRKIVEMRVQWTLDVVERIHAVSKIVKKSYINEFNLPEQKIYVITNGVDVNKFKPSLESNKARERLEGYYPIIVYPARFDKNQKRHDIVVETVRILKEEYNYKPFAYLVGGGDFHYVYESIKSKGLEKNFFVGKLSHEKIIEIYQISDLCLFPTNYEGFSMALLEAAASGLPIIATDLPEIREIVDKNNGVLIKKNDPNLFAKEVARLWENKESLNEKSRNSRKKALEYTWDKITGKVENMLLETLKIFKEV